jgi:CBS-domain-containing membrane protein
VQTTVGNVMTTSVVAAREDATFKEIVTAMRDNHVSALPVVDCDNHVVGVVSEGDLLVKEAAVADRTGSGSWWRGGRRGVMATAEVARDLMSVPAVTIGADASVAEAARLMNERRVKRLPVVTSSGRLVGIISRIDVLSIFGRPDIEIREEVISKIVAGEFGVAPDDLDVTVRSGIVTVFGEVETHAVAVRLLAAIRHVEGVVNARCQLSFPREKLPDTAERHPLSDHQVTGKTTLPAGRAAT